MGGIDIDETRPGFKHIVLQPIPDNRPEVAAGQERIDWVNASFPSCYGDIKERTEKEMTEQFLTPKSTICSTMWSAANPSCTKPKSS